MLINVTGQTECDVTSSKINFWEITSKFATDVYVHVHIGDT